MMPLADGPEGLADYNPESIHALWQKTYHYPPPVILAESLPRLYFKCNGSLGTACTDAIRPGAYFATLLLAGTYL